MIYPMIIVATNYTVAIKVPLYGCCSTSQGMNAPSARTSSGTSELPMMWISLVRVDRTLSPDLQIDTTLQRCHSG